MMRQWVRTGQTGSNEGAIRRSGRAGWWHWAAPTKRWARETGKTWPVDVLGQRDRQACRMGNSSRCMGMSRVEQFPKAHAGIERGANQGVPRLDEPLYFVAMVVLFGLSLVPRLKTLAMAISRPGHGQTTRACFRHGRQSL